MLVRMRGQEFDEITGLTRRHHAQPQHEYRQGERRQTHRAAQRGEAEIWRLAADYLHRGYLTHEVLHNFRIWSGDVSVRGTHAHLPWCLELRAS